ncbi:MAG: leucine-rich repeat domain-containing protein [Lachnospiraceae bacterium]|nr:leucine-rich repeat domain-containing protein [Lachnospiraceae bacterium]
MSTLKKCFWGMMMAFMVSLMPWISVSAVTSSDGVYEYYVNEDGNAVITEYKGSETKLIMPDKVDGKKITEIGDYAFYRCTDLTYIEFPKDLTVIGAEAFTYCYDLTGIEFPDSITEIGESAFHYCYDLVISDLPKNLKKIGNSAFRRCNVGIIRLPKGLTSIGMWALCNADSIVEIPDSVTEIGECAFGSDAVIYAGKGTVAEAYAKENGNGFVDTSADKCKHSYNAEVLNVGYEYTEYKCSKCGYSYSIISHKQPLVGPTGKEYRYSRWYWPIELTLVPTANGYVQVEATDSNSYASYVMVEEYDRKLKFVKGLGIPKELPYYGGFYAGEDAYYFVFGQSNAEEDDNKEVLRIVKYSKDWERIGSDSLYGANTTYPFDAGTLRMCEQDGMLYIKTCHEIYTTPDGLNHQTNMVIIFDEAYMKIIRSFHEVENHRYGYVSHSFNQFIISGKNGIATVDHGDAYPRTIVLHEADSFKRANILAIPNTVNTHYNYTYTTVGGFEASDTHYLVAGSAVHFDENYEKNKTYNIYLGTVPLDNVDDSAVAVNWLTEYAEGSTYSVGTPHLIELDKDNYLLLWGIKEKDQYGWYTGYGKVNAALVDGKGTLRGDIITIDAYLSDCKPIYHNGEVIWYINDWNWDNGYYARNDFTTFYRYRVVWDGGKAIGLSKLLVAADGSPLEGICCVDGAWAYYENGGINTNMNGLVQGTDGWRYVKNGYVDFVYDGLVDLNGTMWYVKEGTIDFAYNGLLCFMDEWYYMNNGAVDKSYNGLAFVNNEWWYVVNGKIDFGFNGLAFVNDAWWYVNTGRIDFGYTGLTFFNDDWWFIQNGCVNFGYTGLAFINNDWWYVVNGKIDFAYCGLFDYDNQKWYVQGGKIDFSYNNVYYFNDIWWYIEIGKVNFGYNGLAYTQFNDKWWYVINGVISFDYTGAAYANEKYWYVERGEIDFQRNGKVTIDGAEKDVAWGEILM